MENPKKPLPEDLDGVEEDFDDILPSDYPRYGSDIQTEEDWPTYNIPEGEHE